jgi:hypothetical protein
VVEISFIDALLVATGALAVVVVASSRLIRSLPVSEPLVALLVGVVLGPQLTGTFDLPPLTEEWLRPQRNGQLLLRGDAGLPAVGAWSVMAARSRGSGAVSSRVPGGPVQVAPPGFVPAAEQQRILAEVLSGVELGAWDQRMVGWLAGWDAATVLTIASWIVRARGMGPVR